MTSQQCVLTFNTSLEKTRAVRINEPRSGLTNLVVTTAANSFISANPFDETVGALTGLKNAELITVTNTVLI